MKKNYYIILLLLLTIFFFIKKDCRAQDIKKDSIEVKQLNLTGIQDSVKLTAKTPNGAMIRSLIFPGLGQWYNNKKFKAVVFFCAETGLLANAIYLNQQLVKSTDVGYKNYYIENRNISVWWLVGVTLFSMADAFVDAHLADFDESPDLSLLRINPITLRGDKRIQVSLCFQF